MAASGTRRIIKINNTLVYRDNIVNHGSDGVQVLHGRFGRDISVAVKRIVKGYDPSKFELEVRLLKENVHEHIVKYYDHGSDDSFFYIAMELCDGTLEDLVSGTYKKAWPGDEKTILHQITKGLAYLHSKKIVHRDLKPKNILIGQPENYTSPPKMKLADFGISKKQTREYYFSNTGSYGTVGWAAPELFKDSNDHFDLSVDIFSLGCIFGYVLTGHHPFGDTVMRSANIVQGKRSWTNKEKLKDRNMKDSIKKMIAHDPKKRLKIEAVLKLFPQSAPPQVTVTPDPKPSASTALGVTSDVRNSVTPSNASPVTSYVRRPSNTPNQKDNKLLSPTSPSNFSYSQVPSRSSENSSSTARPSSPQPSTSRQASQGTSSRKFSYSEKWIEKLEEDLSDLQNIVSSQGRGNEEIGGNLSRQNSVRAQTSRATYPSTTVVDSTRHVNSQGGFERGTPSSSSFSRSSTRIRQATSSQTAPVVSSLVWQFEASSNGATGSPAKKPTKK